MQPDLLYSQACLDWVHNHIPSFQKAIDAWCKANVRVEVKELGPETPNNMLVMKEKEPFPISFNVEAGAYINTIRSSLDILATAVAERHAPSHSEKIYFPIANSLKDYNNGNHTGAKFLSLIPTSEHKILDSFEPYNGGKSLLYALHKIDNMRKHSRLLTVGVSPARFSIHGWGLGDKFTPLATGFVPAGNGETALGLLAKDVIDFNIKYSTHVVISEASFMGRKQIGQALIDFAETAASVIKAFDKV